jgi:hypothetical protein
MTLKGYILLVGGDHFQRHTEADKKV